MQPPFKLRNSELCSVSSLRSQRIFKGLAKALIRLRVCAGWSEALLVAHTTLLEISCRGSIMFVAADGGLVVLSIFSNDRICKVVHFDYKWK